MICFCPGVIFCIFKSVFTNLMKCATWVFSLICRGLQFISAEVVSAYQARQIDEQLDNDVRMPKDPIVRPSAATPFLPTSLVSSAFNDQSVSFHDQSADHDDQFSLAAPPTADRFCDQSGSVPCPPDSRPVTKMLRYKPGAFTMKPGTSTTLKASAPSFQSSHPRPSRECFVGTESLKTLHFFYQQFSILSKWFFIFIKMIFIFYQNDS